MTDSTNGGDGSRVIEISAPELLTRSPLVSVLMVTFNHQEYLAEAIAGVLAQKCDFEFELIIGEDASSDRTRDIALEFQRDHPRVIRVLHSKSNVGISANALRIFRAARGEYLAFCEGDDYWCTPRKLELQVRELGRKPEAAVVHSDWVRARKFRDQWVVDWKRTMHRHVPRSRLEGDLFATFFYPKILRTCTALHRRRAVADMFDSALWSGKYPFVDTVRTVFETSRWMVAYLPAVTAVYRESPNSVLRSGHDARLRFLLASMDFDTDARRYFHERGDYPDGYRWEMSVGLFFKALRVRRWDLVASAWRDIRAHFGPIRFLATFAAVVKMRRPTLLPSRHGVPR